MLFLALLGRYSVWCTFMRAKATDTDLYIIFIYREKNVNVQCYLTENVVIIIHVFQIIYDIMSEIKQMIFFYIDCEFEIELQLIYSRNF